MVEQEFEQLRLFLKQKMPAYLQQRGIKTDSNFSCLNPSHRDLNRSMVYDPNSCCVYCYSCGTKLNIFELVGVDYRLPDFNSQFKKAHELFLGPLPVSIQNYLSNRSQISSDPHASSVRDDDPLFEIEKDRSTSSGEVRSVNFNGGSFEIRPIPPSYRINAVNDTQASAISSQSPHNPFQRGGGLTFGPSNNQRSSESFQNFNSHGSPSESMTISPFGSRHEEMLPEYDFTEYFQKCRTSLSKTNYLKERGISDEVARKFGLGYDDHFIAGSDQFGSQNFWQALVIPLSSGAYAVRNTNTNDNDRYRKNGRLAFFNAQCLEKEGNIFITEGEMDALSLETLGYNAVSLGGAGNVNHLIEKISCLDNNKNRSFYICLDNDQMGIDAAKALASGLYHLHIPYKRIDLAFPYKDINDALVNDKNSLKDRLEHLEDLLTYSLTPLPRKAEKHQFITNADELCALKLSPVLYSFCLRSHTGRNLIAALIDARQIDIAYAGSVNQWQYISSLVKRPPVDQIQESTWIRSGLIKTDPDHIIEDIKQGITAYKVQGENNYVTIADLTSMPMDRCLLTASRLSTLCANLNVPIIALCNQEAIRYVESQSLQNILITQNAHGDFCCETTDRDGKSIDFTLFCTY